MDEKDITFLKNAITDKRCYNCALQKECEKENPVLFEPIGTCGKWTNNLRKNKE